MKEHLVEHLSYVFTLHLKACDHSKFDFHCQSYSLWTSFQYQWININALYSVVPWPYHIPQVKTHLDSHT